MPASYNKNSKKVLIFTPTPNEYKAVKGHVQAKGFKNLHCQVIECGPGRLMVGFAAASALAALEAGDREDKVILVGAGTSGSLNMDLQRGEVILANSAVISDWRMEEGDKITLSPYAWFDYQQPVKAHVEKMVLTCQDPLIVELMAGISAESFRKGRLMTSEGFVAGKELKLSYGARFECLACDMESGAFGFIGENLAKVPWFNVRVVADTLNDTLDDYFAMERDVTEILGNKLVEALTVLDSLI
jgi:nucleoside phosphorylase